MWRRKAPVSVLRNLRSCARYFQQAGNILIVSQCSYQPHSLFDDSLMLSTAAARAHLEMIDLHPQGTARTRPAQAISFPVSRDHHSGSLSFGGENLSQTRTRFSFAASILALLVCCTACTRPNFSKIRGPKLVLMTLNKRLLDSPWCCSISEAAARAPTQQLPQIFSSRAPVFPRTLQTHYNHRPLTEQVHCPHFTQILSVMQWLARA